MFNTVYYSTLVWRLAQGRTSERVSSRHRVRSPVEVATQQTFSILKSILKTPPLGVQDVTYKDPNATVLGTRATAFLFLDGFAVFVLRARESRDIPSTLGFREGMEGPYGCLYLLRLDSVLLARRDEIEIIPQKSAKTKTIVFTRAIP